MGAPDDGVEKHTHTPAHNQVDGVVNGPLVQGGRLGDVHIHSGVASSPSGELNGWTEGLAEGVEKLWRQDTSGIAHQIDNPGPLPVRWHPASRELADHPENIQRTRVGAKAETLALHGRFEEIAEVYRGVPSRRLVILGPVGAGKTAVGSHLAHDLLKTRQRWGPVPVVITLSSWNPKTTSLDDWIAAQLTRDHPGLAASAGEGGRDWAHALVEAGRVLPVLDGFDEIAVGLRLDALKRLNEAPITRPLVLTSLVPEYADAVRGGGVLFAAAVVELEGLSLQDLSGYLPRTVAGPRIGAWDAVLERMRAEPHEAAPAMLACVLRNPLMVFLARTLYSNTTRENPAELLDTSRFASEEALQDHLLREFIPTVYQDGHGRRSRWRADRAQKYLAYIAGHLQRAGTRDLAWWQLRDTIPRKHRTLVFALLDGLLATLVGWLAFGPAGKLGSLLASALIVGLPVTIASCLTAAATVKFANLIGTGRPRREPRSRHRKFAYALWVGIITGVAVDFASTVEPAFGDNAGPVVGLASGLVEMLRGGLARWFRRRQTRKILRFPASRLTIAIENGIVIGLCVGFLASRLDVGLRIAIGLGVGVEIVFAYWIAYGIVNRLRRVHLRGSPLFPDGNPTVASETGIAIGLVSGVDGMVAGSIENGLANGVLFGLAGGALLGYATHNITEITSDWKVALARRLWRSRPRNKVGEVALTLTVGLTTGVAVGLTVMAVWTAAIAAGFDADIKHALLASAIAGVLLGVIAGLTAGFIGFRQQGPQPTRTRLRFRSGMREVASRFIFGLKFGWAFGLAVGFFYGFAQEENGVLYGPAMGVLTGVPTGIAAVLVFRNESPADRSEVDSAAAAESLARDRRKAVHTMLISGLTVGLAVGIPQGVTAGFVAACIGSFLSVRGTSAYIYWLVLVRCWLPITRKLPWRLQDFLKDAHDRGILRQTGAVYRFRHARLQHQLLKSSTGVTPETTKP